MLTHFVIPGFLAFLLVGVSACATNKEVAPVKDEETVTRELFYMVSPSFHIGKDWPRNLSPRTRTTSLPTSSRLTEKPLL